MNKIISIIKLNVRLPHSFYSLNKPLTSFIDCRYCSLLASRQLHSHSKSKMAFSCVRLELVVFFQFEAHFVWKLFIFTLHLMFQVLCYLCSKKVCLKSSYFNENKWNSSPVVVLSNHHHTAAVNCDDTSPRLAIASIVYMKTTFSRTFLFFSWFSAKEILFLNLFTILWGK